MIVKSWKFTGFKSDFPQWIKETTSKRAGSNSIWVHTQQGEVPANEGNWISINLKGHVNVHEKKPESFQFIKEIIAGAAFIIFVLALMVFMLTW